MIQQRHTFVSMVRVLLTGFVLFGCSPTGPEPGNSERESTTHSLVINEGTCRHTAQEAPTGRTGMRVEDPVTGEIEAVHIDDSQEFSTSSEGLKEEPLPGGGTKIDLEGRFRNMLEIPKK